MSHYHRGNIDDDNDISAVEDEQSLSSPTNFSYQTSTVSPARSAAKSSSQSLSASPLITSLLLSALVYCAVGAIFSLCIGRWSYASATLELPWLQPAQSPTNPHASDDKVSVNGANGNNHDTSSNGNSNGWSDIGQQKIELEFGLTMYTLTSFNRHRSFAYNDIIEQAKANQLRHRLANGGDDGSDINTGVSVISDDSSGVAESSADEVFGLFHWWWSESSEATERALTALNRLSLCGTVISITLLITIFAVTATAALVISSVILADMSIDAIAYCLTLMTAITIGFVSVSLIWFIIGTAAANDLSPLTQQSFGALHFDQRPDVCCWIVTVAASVSLVLTAVIAYMFIRSRPTVDSAEYAPIDQIDDELIQPTASVSGIHDSPPAPRVLDDLLYDDEIMSHNDDIDDAIVNVMMGENESKQTTPIKNSRQLPARHTVITTSHRRSAQANTTHLPRRDNESPTPRLQRTIHRYTS